MAREGDNPSTRIMETGAYAGIITVAKSVTSKKGTKGIEIAFKDKQGLEASYLTLWTTDKSGQSIYGEKQLHALMACMKLRSITAQQATVEEYDFDARQNINIQADVYPELMNNPVGLVLQNEEYPANDGSIKNRMVMVGFFNAETRQTASEILDNKPANNIDAQLATLKDKKINTGQQSMNQQNTQQNSQQSTQEPVDFDDSSIPF
jgi:hypothetical protein